MFLMTLTAQEFGGRFHHRGWAHPWLGLLLLLVVAAAIGVGVWALVRGSRPVHDVAPSAPTDPAMQILRTRFAQGQIDAEEFGARAGRLSGVPAPPSPPYPAPPSV